jgi:hypothetical protein
MLQDAHGRYIVTRSEWRAKHADFKLTAAQSQSGEPMMLRYDDRYGTCLVPVVIVAD